MKIAVIPHSDEYLNNRLFTDTKARDDILATYREIKRAAERRSWSIATFDQLSIEEADKVLAFNFAGFPEAVLSALETLGSANMVAIVREPPGIAPCYYDRDINSCFGFFCVTETDIPDGKNIFYLDFPIPGVPVDWIPFEQKKLLVSITSGKFSNFRGSLYDERIKAIKYFQSHIPDKFDMFGQGWEKEGLFHRISPHRLFHCYKGRVSSKHDVMRKYKFSLCYENTCNVPGYVTEKILDSIWCGCVPIYLGAPDIENYIPRSCFIDRRAFSSEKEVEEFISGIGEEEYRNYMRAMRGYLNSEECRKRLPERYALRVLSFLEKEPLAYPIDRVAESRRKLVVLSAKKKIRIGELKEKYKGMKVFLSQSKIADWKGLAGEILVLAARKTGLQDIFVWIKIKLI